MNSDLHEHVVFFLTGRRTSDRLDSVEGVGLRPALFARYRDLSALRYDFPLVLTTNGAAPFVRSLSSVIDDALTAAALGTDGERMRKQMLRVEQTIRTLVVGGATGSFSTLWDLAITHLLPTADDAFMASAARIRTAIALNGDLVDCDFQLPSRLLLHTWQRVQEDKGAAFRAAIDTLLLGLSNILRADHERSLEGRSAAHLQASVGVGFGSAFDFGALSLLLTTALTQDRLPEARRQRLTQLIAALQSQRFYASNTKDAGTTPYPFVFTSCADALRAYHERSAAQIALAGAIAVAELEIEGQYREDKHDAMFALFGANGLDPHELAPFPDYLVCINAALLHADEHAQLMELLTSGLPIKVMLQIDDILEEAPSSAGNLSVGMRIRQIASMAMGLNEVYVLQSSSSNLYRFRDQIVRGLSYRGTALFSVFSGASGASSGLPPYLVSAAAMESRAFPAFSYDPSAGANWASRFSLDANAQVELDWPIQHVEYADLQSQRVVEDVAFTYVDFVASDHRYAKHLARVPRPRWNGTMIPVDLALTCKRKGLPDRVPALLMVDDKDALQRVLVDERLLREARRCREMWHSLQELGGVHNSHAEQLLARERKAWEARTQAETTLDSARADTSSSTTAGMPPAASAATRDVPDVAPERTSDEAYIETARCSTCNECTQLNNRMFAYNANKQAYIADLNAGTYAQLVDAAESCQVSIIHPGKPRNLKEPGLDELLTRAAAFI